MKRSSNRLSRNHWTHQAAWFAHSYDVLDGRLLQHERERGAKLRMWRSHSRRTSLVHAWIPAFRSEVISASSKDALLSAHQCRLMIDFMELGRTGIDTCVGRWCLGRHKCLYKRMLQKTKIVAIVQCRPLSILFWYYFYSLQLWSLEILQMMWAIRGVCFGRQTIEQIPSLLLSRREFITKKTVAIKNWKESNVFSEVQYSYRHNAEQSDICTIVTRREIATIIAFHLHRFF